MQVMEAGLAEPPPPAAQPCPPRTELWPQRCHRSATAWLSGVNLCLSIPPATAATVSKSSMPKGSSTETGKTNPWIALNLHFRLPKQRPLAREGLTMHTQGQDTALREEVAAGAPSTSPDMLQTQEGKLWGCTGLSLKELAHYSRQTQKNPQTLHNWFYAYSVDFMHISYLSWQQSGYKRNQVQDYLLNRWEKSVPCKKVPLNKIQSSSAKPITSRPVLSTNDWISASLWSYKNQTNVKIFLAPQHQIHYSQSVSTHCSQSASITSPSHHHLQYFYPDFYKAWRGQYYLINSETIGFTSARNNFFPFFNFSGWRNLLGFLPGSGGKFSHLCCTIKMSKLEII